MSPAGTSRLLSFAAISEGLAEELVEGLVEELGLTLEDDEETAIAAADEVGAAAELEIA